MGVKDNLKKILEGYRYKHRESQLERDVAQANIADTEFYKKYGSFTDGLSRQLDKIFEEGYKSVSFRPTFPENMKYFRAVMEDEEYNLYYNIRVTSGGEVEFRQKELELDDQ